MRPLFGIQKSYNAKGLGLLLSGYLERFSGCAGQNDLEAIQWLKEWLLENKSAAYPQYYSWGYNFAWANRSFFLARNAPNMVVTFFVASAFLDLYEHTREDKFLEVAKSSGKFFVECLQRKTPDGSSYFHYTPYDATVIHNVNMFGAAFLARLYFLVKQPELLAYAEKSVAYTMQFQKEDGSWCYGEDAHQKWVDSFHTGYILMALADYGDYTKDITYQEKLKKGYDFFKKNFIFADGSVSYYPQKKYPVDAHALAVGILTVLKMRFLDRCALEDAKKIALWSIEHMQDQKGYFYYQKHKIWRNTINYIRWSQCWMFKALVHLVKVLSDANGQQKDDLGRF